MKIETMDENGCNAEVSDHDPFPFARSYQKEALEQAMRQNTIVFLETGTGKTLIASMLLSKYAHLLQKPSPNVAVFLVPTVVLVIQQAEAVRKHLGLKVAEYWGGKGGVNGWNADDWNNQQVQNQVMVMTPAILHAALTRRFLSLETIKVLIFDECHNAKKSHDYALIMTEFYHRALKDGCVELPRILGMTASPVKAKGSTSEEYWKQIKELEILMNSKVFTTSESVLGDYISFGRPKYKFYEDLEFPDLVFDQLKSSLSKFREKYETAIRESNLLESTMNNAMKKLSRFSSTFEFCLQELGIWLTVKAAEEYASQASDLFTWGNMDVSGEKIVREFCRDVKKVFSSYIPDAGWMINHIDQESVSIGLLSAKVVCLIESLSEYRHVSDMRCIIFVERVTTAMVLKSLLTELSTQLFGWKTECIASNYSKMQSQSRSAQNRTVEGFRKGMVNIIVATSVLEEGLDVQSCNLVIRFDLPATVCSFIQSRGRARMLNSEFLLLIRSGDTETLKKVNNYLSSGKIMRDVSLSHASEQSEPLDTHILDADVYHVESTGATVGLKTSIAMVNLYCSRLPSDGYFKPEPRFEIDKEAGTCTIVFPKSCPVGSVQVKDNFKTMKQRVCLEACKQLHKMGALTNNLVPAIVEEDVNPQEIGYDYVEEQVQYVPPELVGRFGANSTELYHFYSVKLKTDFECDFALQDIMLGVKTQLEIDNEGLPFDLEAGKGNLFVTLTYLGTYMLTSDQITLSAQFQMTVLRVLLDHSLKKLEKSLEVLASKNEKIVFDYLLLPATQGAQLIFDWHSVRSVGFPFEDKHNCCLTSNHHNQVHTMNGLVCSCLLENALVYTPHNERLYCTTKMSHHLNSNSPFRTKDGVTKTYKSYYKTRYGINLKHEEESLVSSRKIFAVRRGRHHKENEIKTAEIELPSELCYIIMSPVSTSIFYTFSFLPAVMHRIESWLIAVNLKKMHLDSNLSTANVPAMKILEAITTKKCLEKFHLETLETLGDSFLKYAATQQLFKSLEDQHEGILSSRRQEMISNDLLCSLGCQCNLPGFIRNAPFDPKTWVVPGDPSGNSNLKEEVFPTGRKAFIGKTRTIKKKVVADVVEALIGVFLSEGGEMAALSFMGWFGIEVDFVNNTPDTRNMALQPENFLRIHDIESSLNYSFRDASLLVEALTHGSCMLPNVPRCYQRLEFLGDAVLDYLITQYLFKKHPGMSPGMLTDLRSASVNNDCYAQSAIRAELHKYILHGSQALNEHIDVAVGNFKLHQSQPTFGWESNTSFPKVLGDIMESIAGAIFVDSGYDKDRVFKIIRPLLEPLITPETLRLHPVKELHDLVQRCHLEMVKSVKRTADDSASFTIKVVVEGTELKRSCVAQDKKMAERLAAKSVLNLIREIFPDL